MLGIERIHSVKAVAIAFALAPLLLACGSYVPPNTTFTALPPSANDWSAALARPARVTLETFESGRIRVRLSEVLDLEDPRAHELRDEETFVPVFAHLLHHDDLGDYLIDSGLDRSFQTTTSGDIGGLFASRIYAVQRPGEDIASRLLERHASLHGIFFTHLHPDHLSGATSLPKNIKYVAGPGETPKSVGFFFYEDALRGVTALQTFDFTHAPSMPPLGPCIDVFGDGSLWAISTPGHTAGHVSYLIVTKSGPVLLTGDASHTRWGFEHGVAPGDFNDGKREDARRSLDQLIAFSRAYPQVKVVLGHAL